MLSQLAHLSTKADGRYATAYELQFLKNYFKSFNLRISAYQKIKAAEAEIIQKVQAKIKSINPNLFNNGSEDATSKWRLDTMRVLRQTAAALLIDDAERLRNRFVVWFKTVLRALNVEESADITYKLMLETVSEYLTPEEAALFRPLWELNRLDIQK